MAHFPSSVRDASPEEAPTHHGLVKRTRVLLGVAILFLACVGGIAYHQVAETSIDGPIYHQIISQQKLLADVKLSPLSIIDSQLAVYESLDPENNVDLPLLEQRLDALEQRYHTALMYWLSRIDKDSLPAQMLQESAEPAREFFQLTKVQLIPLLREEKFADAQRLAHGKLDSCYRRNRSSLNRLQPQLENEVVETRQRALQDPALWWLLGFLVVSIGMMVIVLWQLSTA